MAAEIVVHGHFYQPPRDNPWTGTIDEQPTAAPFPNWNERVHAECYRPNAFVEIPNAPEPILVNNFEHISFNVGPTLLGWLENAHPDTYGRIVAADQTSRIRLGHGNAIAQAYHHTILPLSPARDVRTEIAWGIADFRHRFGRAPAGMWVGETAVNDLVLHELIEAGVGFTILAPWQAAAWKNDDSDWLDARDHPIDTRVAYRYDHSDGSGRSLSLFFYDAEIARAIAFERATSSAEDFLWLFARRDARPGHLVHAATDGETYGHHHKFSELGLAYALAVLAPRHELPVTNYSAYLAGNPARSQARVVPGEGSSWSCAHGVGRWMRDCGCSTGGHPGGNQRWRTPLRTALEVVRDAADRTFEEQARPLLRDPWTARNHYVNVRLGAVEPATFVASEATGKLDAGATARALDLLEMQASSLSMFTSCAWFFNDVAGIETRQVLRYAARTLDLIDGLDGPAPLAAFLDILARADSNDPEARNGAEIFASSAARVS